MQKKHLVAAAVVALFGAGIAFFLLRGGDAEKTSPGAGRGSVASRVDPKRHVDGAEAALDPLIADPEARFQRPDPAGKLLLEGQVLDEDDEPVAGAQVWLTSAPPRSATTEGDGSFSFDHLLPREYAVTARAGDSIGGPVTVRVSASVGPVVVRLRAGSTLTVKVTDEESKGPVSGAKVGITAMGHDPETTNGDGVAELHGVRPGWTQVKVKADGYAPAQSFTMVGAAGSSREVKVTLRKGAPLRGKVVTEGGEPIEGALMTLADASSAWGGNRDTATSEPDGTFEFPVVASGSYHVTARDDEHAPASSELLTVDGRSAVEDVIVTMKTGATIRGRVVTRDQQPGGFATVQVAPKLDQRAGIGGDFADAVRSTTCDEAGTFELRGLPHAALKLRASNDDAASAITDVDLTAADQKQDVVLVLDVVGVIAGVVVDADGQPVAEAQVSAFPDILGTNDSDIENLGMAGLTADTTDGGGAFRLHGLADGKYRLWASRTAGQDMAFGDEGTAAATGDVNVRIVLPKPGGVEGKVAFADGTTPAQATVTLGFAPAVTTTDGTFLIEDVPPGKHDLHVRGSDFAELVQRDVEVTAGETHDLGTLTISKGRRVSGRVVDASGAPVEGARVMVGVILFSQGTTATDDDAALGEQFGLRTATSNADGAWTIQGAPAKGGKMIAEHTSRGRSDALALPPGDQDVADVTLVVHGFGSIHGKVTKDGQPAANVGVMASAKGSQGHAAMVQTGGDGTFAFDKMPAGTHTLAATEGSGMSIHTTTKDVTVTEGKSTEVAIELAAGKVTLTVTVKGKDGAHLDAAQLFLLRGKVAITNAQEAVDLMLAGQTAGMTVWFGGTDLPKFEKLEPGQYSICTIPINGNVMDPEFSSRLQENMEKVKLYCQGKTITASPLQQTATQVLPPMEPLPPE